MRPDNHPVVRNLDDIVDYLLVECADAPILGVFRTGRLACKALAKFKPYFFPGWFHCWVLQGPRESRKWLIVDTLSYAYAGNKVRLGSVS